MATLELAIDATKAQQGAQVAEQALKRVQTAAEGTGKAVQDAGTKMSAAFQATGGSIQIAGGLAQTAKAFGELNIQAGLFSSSRLLLEIGKTTQDFKELASGVKGVGGAFSVLSQIIRANPLLAAATAIGAIASAIGFFTTETKKATDAYAEFGATLEKQRVSARAAQYLGIAGPGPQGSLSAIQGVAEQQVLPGAAPMNLQQFGQLGYGATAARYLAQRGTPEQQAEARAYFRRGGSDISLGYGTETVSQFERGRLPDIQLDAAQTQAILRGIYQSIQQEAPIAAATVSTGAITTGGGTSRYTASPMMGMNAFENAAATAAMIANYKKQEAEDAKRVAENFARAADYAGQVGGSLGSAFADVLMKTTTLRQAFASIVASFARQGLSDIGTAIFRGAVSGLTPTQAGANVGINNQASQ